jgi:hypothetical protein
MLIPTKAERHTQVSEVMGSDFAPATHHCPSTLRAQGKQELQYASDAKSSSHKSRRELLPFFVA